jgi:ParB-like chromosome segregation protein Spo0J
MDFPQIEPRRVGALRPYKGNARTHSKKQIKQIAASIEQFGFTNPVLVSDDDEIIAGHGRVLAARELGMKEVPTLRLSHLSPEQRRAYVLADNKLALNAGWDQELLSIELQGLIDFGFDVELIPAALRPDVAVPVDTSCSRKQTFAWTASLGGPFSLVAR